MIDYPLNTISIIGAGTMGQGIAQWFAQQGKKTLITDTNEDALARAKENIDDSFAKLLGKNKFSEQEIKSFKENLTFEIHSTKIHHESDLIIEAIIENSDIKSKLFLDLDNECRPSTIFASNTSSIPIRVLSKDLSDKRKKRFLGIHFFNPATIMKLVELIPSSATDHKLIGYLKSYFEEQGKKIALCSDTPGFIVNKVARNFYGEAFRLAKKEDKKRFYIIDQVLKKVGNFPMGPFELMDHIGIDVNYDVTKSVWQERFYEPRYKPHHLQRLMVESKRLGKKTKKGFYQYES